jgi:ribose-phosphate pyrophosphokinase
MSVAHKRMQIFTGNANPDLAASIAKYLDTRLCDSTINRFSDGEIQVRIGETVRGSNVFLVQPVCHPVNDNLMELLIMIDAVRRASAKHIAAVIPYYGYARQDRKLQPRDPITAKLLANLITAAGADRVLTIDLHAGQIQGFFDIPVDNLFGIPILAQYCNSQGINGSDAVVVSPDVGGVARARTLAERLDTSFAIIDKRRPRPNVAEVLNIIGDVKDKTAIIIDDMIDTAGTVAEGAKALIQRGATKVYACCTHPVLSGPAISRLEEAPIEQVIVTDTIPLPPEKQIPKIKVLSVSGLLAEAIKRIYEQLSVSRLFDY